MFAQVFGSVIQSSGTSSTAPDSSSSLPEHTGPVVVEYPLRGPPTEKHYRVALILFKTSGIYESISSSIILPAGLSEFYLCIRSSLLIDRDRAHTKRPPSNLDAEDLQS